MADSILIAEDYPDARSFMVAILEMHGFHVIEAANGSEAVELACRHRPDLILMDISMPVMDGIQATKVIRSSESGISRTPIIVITAFDDEVSRKAIDAGCNEVIPKPIAIEKLEQTMQKYLH